MNTQSAEDGDPQRSAMKERDETQNAPELEGV